MIGSAVSYAIKDLKIINERYILGVDKEKAKYLENLRKINIFIGANNSGKSRLLRDILKNDITYIPTYSIEEVNIILQDLKKDLLEVYPQTNTSTYRDISNQIAKIEDVKEISKDFNLNAKLLELKEFLFKMSENTSTRTHDNIPYNEIGIKLLGIFKENYDTLYDDFPQLLNAPTFTKIYIPPLRGLKPLEGDSYHDIYGERIKKDYFPGSDQVPLSFSIFTGLETYSQIRSHLLGNLSQRELIREYEKYLSTTFFDGDMVTLIPYEKPDRLVIKIGKEKEQPIQELGDGIQSIIILTFPLFLNKGKNVLLFIDEPEMSIHPGLQRKLIETLLNQEGFERFQFFLTTHSNHFLDITIDYQEICLFSLRKFFLGIEKPLQEQIPRFFIESLSHGDHSALEILGVRNSSIFLSNCTIWVEGVTDRKYFRKYLELYERENKGLFQCREDWNYSFVEYGGSNITHWSFLDEETHPIDVERLCGKLFLIADPPDPTSEKKIERHKKLTARLQNRFCELPCKEVENLLMPSVLKKILVDYGEDLTEINDFEYTSYQDKSLGDFLDSLLGETKKRSYASGKSISDKVNFCDKAIRHINKWGDMSENAQNVTKSIVEFIKSKNIS